MNQTGYQKLNKHFRRHIVKRLKSLRRALAKVDALPQLSLLGVLAGLATGAIILLFRMLIEMPLGFLLPDGSTENFEALEPMMHFLLPVLGALVLAFIWNRLPPAQQNVGVSHVINRFNNYQGHMPLRNAVAQFFGGAIAVISGHSVGREGPAVHLGAACSSGLGQWLRLPNNSTRTLVGCGVAAAIAASFNTPIAGVIFAMEVVLMEYSITGFIPIMLASVAGTIMSHLVYGNVPAFSIPHATMDSLAELPFIALTGILIGTVAACFIYLQTWVARYAHHPIWLRFIAAGVITGGVAVVVPEVMGIGYDSLEAALRSQLTWETLLVIGLAKLLVTGVTVRLGIPGGIIGPTLFIGACIGGLGGWLADWSLPESGLDTGLYVLIGMGAMMGAVLNAPLAALMAIMELTTNSKMILPSMLGIVIACLICSETWKQKSLFLTILRQQGATLTTDPLMRVLRRVGVASIMDRSFRCCQSTMTRADAQRLLEKKPVWLVVEQPQSRLLMRAADLARFLETEQESAQEPETPDLLNLLAIPAQRLDIKGITLRSTLDEALNILEESGADALYIKRPHAPMISPVVGILTKDAIENYYHYRPEQEKNNG